MVLDASILGVASGSAMDFCSSHSPHVAAFCGRGSTGCWNSILSDFAVGHALWRAHPLVPPQVQTIEPTQAFIIQGLVGANSWASRKGLNTTTLDQCFDVYEAFSGAEGGVRKEEEIV